MSSFEREIQSNFSYRQIGSITHCIDTLPFPFTLEWAHNRFNEEPEAEGIPVEQEGVLLGVLDRDAVSQLSENWLGQIKEKDLLRLLGRKPAEIEANDYIETVFDRTMRDRDGLLPKFFQVYYKRSYMGIVSFGQILKRINELRNLEMDHAKEVQDYLLSRASKGETAFTLQTFNRMAGRVGGDFYTNFSYADGQRRCVACFDVSGKGLAASLTTTILGSFFEAYSHLRLKGQEPSFLTRALDVMLDELSPEETFVAAVLVYVDLEQQTLQIQNCGLTPVFVLEPETGQSALKILEPDLPPLGLGQLKPANQTFREVKIRPGLRLAIYTDGLPEMRDPYGVMFGEKKTEELVLASRGKDSKEFMSLVEQAIDRYLDRTPQVDDITLLDLRF